MQSGLIDMHSHILPGLDDGCPNLADSIETARQYVSSGFSAVTATPHHIHGSAWSAKPEKILMLINELQTALTKNNIPLKLFTGMEIAICNQFQHKFERGDYIPLGNSNTFLLEFPLQGGSRQTITELCRRLADKKENRFLIAHPERCAVFQDNPNKLEQLHDNGCLIQLNFGSMLGWYGRRSRSMAFSILERKMCHILSTDCHCSTNRTVPTVGHIEELCRLIGEDGLKQAMLTNPAKIHLGKSVPAVVPAKDASEKKKVQADPSRHNAPAAKGSFFKSLTKLFK